MDNVSPQSEFPKQPNGLGMASFAIGIIDVIITLVTFVVAGIVSIRSGGDVDESSVVLMIIGLVIILCVLAGFVGIGLGVAGILVRRNNRLFAILGTVINTALVIIIIGVIIAGMSIT